MSEGGICFSISALSRRQTIHMTSGTRSISTAAATAPSAAITPNAEWLIS